MYFINCIIVYMCEGYSSVIFYFLKTFESPPCRLHHSWVGPAAFMHTFFSTPFQIVPPIHRFGSNYHFELLHVNGTFTNTIIGIYYTLRLQIIKAVI